MFWGGRNKGRGGFQPQYSSSKDKSQKQQKHQQSFELKFEHQDIPLDQINIDAPNEFQISVGTGFSAKKIVHKIINGKDVVIKALDISNSRIWQELQREVKVFEATSRFDATDEILKEGKKHILSYYGVATDSQTSTGFIVLEKADTNLLNILKLHTDMIDNSTELIPNQFWTQCAMDISTGMHFLHTANIYHRDLQMENCLLFMDGNSARPFIKVSDFGGSLFHSDSPISFCGNRRLSAPEILKQRMENQPLSAYSTSADVFMFGCMLYEMAEGWRGNFRLFPGVADPKAFHFILDGKRPTFSDKRASRIRPEFVELIHSCWDQDPKKRPSFIEVYQKLWKILLSIQPSSASEHNNNNNSATQTSITTAITGPSKHLHTFHLYMADEVLSALEKSIRRNQTEEALYWTAELLHSNLPQLAWDKLFIAVSSDISIASVHTTLAVTDAYLKWKEKQDPVFLFQAAQMVASAPKNRIVVFLLLDVMRQFEQHLKEAENGNRAALATSISPEAIKLPPKLTIPNLYFVVLYNFSKPKFSDFIIDLIKLLSDNNSAGFMNALLQVETFQTFSQESSILRLFHAGLMLQYPQFLQGAPFPVPAKNMYEQYLKPVPGLPGRHPLGIPSYAIDRSTLRGSPSSRDTVFTESVNTLPLLEQAAKEHQVDCSEWGSAEICKSHGAARIRFLNRKLGTPTFVGDEQTTGWWIPQTQEIATILKNHKIDMKNITEFLLQWEETYGSEMCGTVDIMKMQAQRIKTVFA